MIDKRYPNLIQSELDIESLKYWFNYSRQKFLHNIDTFYYSVKFQNDFRYETHDLNVQRFRKFFEIKYRSLQQNDFDDFRIDNLDKDLVLKPVTFSRIYTICLSHPEYFDIFFCPVAPKGADGGPSVTCECIVQIRSYMLWQFGVRDCFENSYEVIKKIAAFFRLDIDFVQENRVDYCWHTNYLQSPEEFFETKRFYRMKVSHSKTVTTITNNVGSDDYEIDYVALGKRSDKVFIRIYQKSREVIEQGYKPWFLAVWKMNGLINAYDMYVYEKAYQKRSWFYRFYARLEFYAEYGADPDEVRKCKDIISGVRTIEENDLIKYADKLTPRLNTIVNIEYQTMRRHSKSYELVPFKDHRNKGEARRIYDYLDNRKIITDYLTNKQFRLVDFIPEVAKADRPMCAFWEALRRTKCLDMKMTSDGARLLRNYNKRLSSEAVKKRFINSAVTFGLYVRGENNDSPMQDAFEAMLRMNDNDLNNARKFKTKKLRQLNKGELAEVFESNELHQYVFVDSETGESYSYDTLVRTNIQAPGGDQNAAIDWADI